LSIYRAASVCALLFLAACGSTSRDVTGYTPVSDLSGLVEQNSIAPTQLFVRPDAPELSSYQSFIVDPIAVRYDDPSQREISGEDLARMQDYFRGRVVRELQASGKTVTTRADSATARISFTLSGISAPNAAANATNILIPVSPSVGEVTIEAAFSDSLTDRVDAVVVDRSRGSTFLNATPWSTWADIENAFDVWAVGIGSAVRQ